MEQENLTEFDLQFPGYWISGDDRDWAFQSQIVLEHIQSLFEEAVAACAKFEPITDENYRESLE